MGFFDIPLSKGVKQPLKEAPVKMTAQLQWAMDLLKALSLCTDSRKDRENLHCIHVKHLPSGKYQVQASDGNILLRVLLQDEHISALSAATGESWDIDSEAFWLPANRAREDRKAEGWDMTVPSWPDVDRVIPTKFEHGPASRALRPWFTFEMLQRVQEIYRLLDIHDPYYRHYWFNGIEGATCDRREVYPACMVQVDMLLLVMPARNPELEFEGMNEIPEEVTR